MSRSALNLSMDRAMKVAFPPEACGLLCLLINFTSLQVSACLLSVDVGLSSAIEDTAHSSPAHGPLFELGDRPHVNKRKNSQKGVDR